MTRCLLMAVLFCGLLASPSFAQKWAEKLFKAKSHDFGAVARGSKQQFEFEIENSYVEDLHIASVRSSCGCTSPTITKRDLKTWEKSAVVATFNTHSFLGQRSATLTVVIDRPYYAEVQLQVGGYVRSDVVFDPGAINFGEVDAGNATERRVRVNYAGRSDWRIVDIRAATAAFEVELNEVGRAADRVSYELLVRMKPSSSAGFFQEQLTVVTNDRQNRHLSIPVEGKVVSQLNVYPNLLSFVVAPGENATKKLVLRAKQPFRIKAVNCPADCFSFEVSKEAKKLHFVPVTFKAGEQATEIDEPITIETDLAGGLTANCRAAATVK